jgi:hypothetical protein
VDILEHLVGHQNDNFLSERSLNERRDFAAYDTIHPRMRQGSPGPAANLFAWRDAKTILRPLSGR